MRPLKRLTLEALGDLLANTFGEVEDPRTTDQLRYPLHDTLRSGFAVMFFQHPRLWQFQRARTHKRRLLPEVSWRRVLPRTDDTREDGAPQPLWRRPSCRPQSHVQCTKRLGFV